MFQPKGNKFQIGYTGNNDKKYVVADSGTNLFFAIYQTSDGIRKYNTVPLEEVIARMKQGLNHVNEIDENGNMLLFYISPNDLVYIPSKDEFVNGIISSENIDTERVYRFVDSSGTTANFVQNTIANVIYHMKKEEAECFCNNGIIQDELGKGSPQSKNQKALTEEMIKDLCIPLTVNRLGEIKIR